MPDDMLENAPDFAGSLDGSRKFLVKLGGVPVDLGQSKNLFGQLGKRARRANFVVFPRTLRRRTRWPATLHSRRPLVGGSAARNPSGIAIARH